MSSDPMPLSPSVVLAILVLAATLLVVMLVVLVKHRRDSLTARDRQAEVERAWAERALHLEGAVAAAESEIQRLRDLDRRDGLTGVANRATFLEAFQVEWRRNRREATPLAAVFFAVDGFKTIDRSQGSDAGDDCLRSVAAVLSTGLRRAGDVVGRWGAERFVVALPNTTLEGATAVARRLAADVEAFSIPGATAGDVSTVTLSAGLAATVPGKGDPEPLLAAAEAALAAALSRGPRQVVAAPEVQGSGPA
ncbi:MAG: diguanylate cyclase [Holophagales bacterium]|nr:diguanylate cyclase [Holophagales bacterium]